MRTSACNTSSCNKHTTSQDSHHPHVSLALTRPKHETTGTSTITQGQYFHTALAWRCTLVGGPLGVRGAHPPPVGPRRPRELPPHVPIGTREKPNKLRHDRHHFHQLVLRLRHRNESRGRRRHFHLLFRQLRLLERGTLQDRVLKNLGHFDDLLDVRQRVAAQERGGAGRRAQYLHDAPQDSLLRPGHGRQPVRPRALDGR